MSRTVSSRAKRCREWKSPEGRRPGGVAIAAATTRNAVDRFMLQETVGATDMSISAARVSDLRRRLRALSLDGYIVPRADEHQGESVPKASERLAWLTGFTGSAGTGVVLGDRAAIFVDGRYSLQVREQVDRAIFEPVAVGETSVADWLKANAGRGQRIGYDPWLVTRAEIRRIADALAPSGVEVTPVDENPIDAIWPDRPAPPLGAVAEQPEDLAGRSVEDKVGEIARVVAERHADAAVLTDPASIAWLFNIRGGDVPHTPFALSFAIARAVGRPELFIDGRKLSNVIRDRLHRFADIFEPGQFADRLRDLGATKAKVLFDRAGSAEAVARFVEAAGGTIVEGADPVALPKARKNAAELAGSRAAHLRDGVALMRFLRFIEASEPGSLTEIAAAERLAKFRRNTAAEGATPLADLSFETISSAGPNAAIVHYHPSGKTNRPLDAGDLYLVDSGAQYRDGTTDVTRTLLIGEAQPERLDLYRDRYTRVLKGHIAIADARFPKGTSGAQIDALARVALWKAGLDFDHGTGHGVGAYLSVHEGPQRISKLGHTALEPGMILSNEPGYYRAGEFGIRIENLVVVGELEAVPGGDRPMHRFETLTLAPMDRRLIASRLLDSAERAWLDSYHQRVFGMLSGWPTLTDDERGWLEAACRPLGD
jgi:Xaa-Pro aminopeptidase